MGRIGSGRKKRISCWLSVRLTLLSSRGAFQWTWNFHTTLDVGCDSVHYDLTWFMDRPLGCGHQVRYKDLGGCWSTILPPSPHSIHSVRSPHVSVISLLIYYIIGVPMWGLVLFNNNKRAVVENRGKRNLILVVGSLSPLLLRFAFRWTLAYHPWRWGGIQLTITHVCGNQLHREDLGEHMYYF